MDELFLIIIIGVFVYLVCFQSSRNKENLENMKQESACKELCVNNKICNDNCDAITQQEKDASRYAKLIFG
jgi:hypothetical protein